ncbi:uncharacterized protein OCT59_004885 [Rhizophagus irregularis]|uniref:uncharacterized protein n=1 Tax=Rhizophagus irregularis TaxID=588596 RepID=UPI003321D5E4|nr:hypothetical protein OCT59_004885 [Rhizophagus irregularis]
MHLTPTYIFRGPGIPRNSLKFKKKINLEYFCRKLTMYWQIFKDGSAVTVFNFLRMCLIIDFLSSLWILWSRTVLVVDLDFEAASLTFRTRILTASSDF